LARLILDTSLLVSAERDGIDAIGGLIGDEDDVAVAAITAAELLVGVELADEPRRAARRGFVETVLEAISVEDYDLDVAAVHATLAGFADLPGVVLRAS
jgi:tRNA(fMet)-specific endonuclease VapC